MGKMDNQKSFFNRFSKKKKKEFLQLGIKRVSSTCAVDNQARL